MRLIAFLCFAVLTACADWPDAGGPPMPRSAKDWPVLLPLDDLIETGEVETASETETNDLRARAAALRNRAAILRGSASDMEALRARLPR